MSWVVTDPGNYQSGDFKLAEQGSLASAVLLVVGSHRRVDFCPQPWSLLYSWSRPWSSPLSNMIDCLVEPA